VRAKCPKCEEPITVPAPADGEESSKRDKKEEQPEPSSDQEAYEDPFAQFLVYDDESELIYATEEEDIPPYAEDVPVDPTRVAVPRRVLYMQGALLGVVAIACFALGVLVGLGTSGGRTGTDGPQPCFLRGTIALGNGGDETTPDEGAVAIVVPQGVRPEQKADIEGLRPQDVPPDENHPGLRAIRSIGGDYARADENGNFELRVPDTGEYYLLIISANRFTSDDDQPKNVLAQIGRFFTLAPDLFGGNEYRWQQEPVRRDRELNVVF